MEPCGCKGVRVCIQCEKSTRKHLERPEYGNLHWPKASFGDQSNSFHVNDTWYFCLNCHCLHPARDSFHFPSHTDCKHTDINPPAFQGVYIKEEFISKEEEQHLIQEIDKETWIVSQSGRFKQDFGPRVNFKKQKIKWNDDITKWKPMPNYSRYLIQRLNTHVPDLKDFVPIEQAHLEYTPERGSSIDPHCDDTWLWGERIVIINLGSDTIMSFFHSKGHEVQAHLKARSLLLIHGEARYQWLHAIRREWIQSRRLSLTFREATPEFRVGPQAQTLLERAYQSALHIKHDA